EFVPALEDMDLSKIKIALYGLGDQKGYPENFQDGMGLFAEILEKQGATIVGFTSIKGYTFEKSKAQREANFVGLAIDYENQAALNKKRIPAWVAELKKQFS
nr:flavodoxin domain-containing protein [Bacteroidales bacterium]